MAQYREYITEYRISAADIVMTSTFVGGVQKSDTILRDGSMDTNFKTACAAHRDIVLSLSPSSTSPPCYVTVRSKWLKLQANATVTSDIATIKVPTGNSGKMKVYFEATSTGTLKYKIAAGSFTTITTGTEITLTDGQTLSFQGLTMEEQEFINGEVVDTDTGIQLDTISLMNSTPTP